MKIKSDRSELTEAEVVAFETEFGLSFPLEYREFLLQYNCATVLPSGFKYGKGTYSESGIRYFFGIHGGAFYDNLRKRYLRYKVEDKRMPEEVIPIGADPGGSLFCIAVDGENNGAVYSGTMNKKLLLLHIRIYTYMVATTFKGFLEGLYEI